MLKPFFTYYGGKYRAAPHYPAPRFDTIVEPFAGAAGYALRYADRAVVLVDKDPTIAALWAYLVRVSASEIRALPDIRESVDEIATCSEARSLVGFWLNKGAARPCLTPSAWMRGGTCPRSYWGPEIRERIASQVDRIRHWRVICGTYADAPDVRATWFIDPPYQIAGTHYKHGSRAIDFADLGRFCVTRLGHVIACENEGATWLPFEPFRTIQANPSKHGGKESAEVIWIGGLS